MPHILIFKLYLMAKYQLGLMTATEFEGCCRAIFPHLSTYEPEKLTQQFTLELLQSIVVDKC